MIDKPPNSKPLQYKGDWLTWQQKKSIKD